MAGSQLISMIESLLECAPRIRIPLGLTKWLAFQQGTLRLPTTQQFHPAHSPKLDKALREVGGIVVRSQTSQQPSAKPGDMPRWKLDDTRWNQGTYRQERHLQSSRDMTWNKWNVYRHSVQS